MNVKKCYELMGGNYDECFSRLRSDDRIEKFLTRFLDDGTFSALEKAVESSSAEEAFRAAHTLKGIALNLSLTGLFTAASNLTEALRGKTEISGEAKSLFGKVGEVYALTVNSIKSQG